MSAKTQVNLTSAYRLLHPMHIVLVSCIGKAGKPNITTLAWAMPTSNDPPLVAISVSPKRHSHTLIEETGEFIVNIPTLELLQAASASLRNGTDEQAAQADVIDAFLESNESEEQEEPEEQPA